MLDLFDSVPAPKVGGLLVGTLEMPWIREQLVREDRGEMLERHGCSEADDRRPPPGDREALLDPLLELAEIVPALLRALVEGVMLAAVNRFLRRERLDLLGELRRSSVAERAHALDEKGLTLGKGRRKRVVDSGRFYTPAVPKSRGRGIAAEAAVTWRDA